MSASMAEVLREALRDHRVVWETTHDDEVLLARCKSCGYLSVELETWEHQANVASEILAANGYGKLEEGCDRTANVPSEGFEFLPTCLGCGETLVHDYYHGELAYRHKETQ